MGINLDLTNDTEFEQSIENSGKTFVNPKDLEWIAESGIYASEISSAIVKTITSNQTGETSEIIECTCIAYSKTNEVLGKFKFSVSLDSSSKFFNKTKELCFVTGNLHGCEESIMTRKDGSEVLDSNNNPIRCYKDFCNKRIYVGIMRKGENYGSDGTVYPKYSLWFLYNENRQTCREAKYGLEPTTIKKDWATLQAKIKEAEEQQRLLNKVATPAPKPAPAPKPVLQEPAFPRNTDADDDMPF